MENAIARVAKAKEALVTHQSGKPLGHLCPVCIQMQRNIKMLEESAALQSQYGQERQKVE